jgi:hypothetical protein
MFDNRSDPEHLLSSLHFLLGQVRGPFRAWHGIDPDKLAQSALPDPLRRLYSFAGNCPGDNPWASAFSNQDHLCPFELLRFENDRLVFAWENQGVWCCGTLAHGKDPAVWVRFDQPEWLPLCDSLAQFLVTLCLQELVFGSSFLGHADNACALSKSHGKHVSPLWLNGPFPSPFEDGPMRERSFHLVDGRMLIIDNDWCGTNDEELASQLPELLKPQREPEVRRSSVPLWENPELPSTVKRLHLQSLAMLEEEQARFHAERAQGYRKLAGSFPQ